MWQKKNCRRKGDIGGEILCGKMGQNLHCRLILTKTDMVLSNFDECIGCSVVIVSKCGLVMQQSLVMIRQTIIHGLLTSHDVSKSVKESTGSAKGN
jgi:hypothetical protein